MEINWADVTIVTIIVASVIISVIRGFVREALSLATWIIALWVGIAFAPELASTFSTYIDSEGVRLGLSYFILFVGALVLGTMISFAITQTVQKTGLSGTDRLFGIVFGIGRGVLIVVLVIMLMSLTNLNEKSWWTSSKLIPAFLPLADKVASFLPEEAKDELQDITDEIPEIPFNNND